MEARTAERRVGEGANEQRQGVSNGKEEVYVLTNHTVDTKATDVKQRAKDLMGRSPTKELSGSQVTKFKY